MIVDGNKELKFIIRKCPNISKVIIRNALKSYYKIISTNYNESPNPEDHYERIATSVNTTIAVIREIFDYQLKYLLHIGIAS